MSQGERYTKGTAYATKAYYPEYDSDEEFEQCYGWDEDMVKARKEAPRVAVLPHCRESWIIGGPEEIRLLIADLNQLLEDWNDG